jgi:hypothetical protein
VSRTTWGPCEGAVTASGRSFATTSTRHARPWIDACVLGTRRRRSSARMGSEATRTRDRPTRPGSSHPREATISCRETLMTLDQLAMFGIVAVVLLTLSHRFVRRRRYQSELDSLGFAPCLGDLTPATTALESLRATRRLGGSPVRVRSARRIGEGDRSIFHCLEVSGTGKSRSESFVFAAPRSGEGPVCPIVVLTNPTGGRTYGALAPLARAKIKGEPLRIYPPCLCRVESRTRYRSRVEISGGPVSPRSGVSGGWRAMRLQSDRDRS